MSKQIIISSDSTCDLSRELVERYQIKILPMGVSLGDTIYQDGVNITPDEIYAHHEKTGQLPKTSAISMGEYEEAWKPYVDQGHTVIHINLGSALSASHQNARLAAEEVGNVYPVDSRSLSTGSGHLVLMARELIDAGMTAQEIVAALEEAREKLDVSFVLQTLEYLHKGGRCSGVAAFGANLMKLRPEIEVVDGKMQVGRKYRGNMEKTVLAYIRGRLEGREDIRTERIFITHSGVPQDILEKAEALVRELHPFNEVLITTAGSSITSHCGPNCLGVLFLKK